MSLLGFSMEMCPSQSSYSSTYNYMYVPGMSLGLVNQCMLVMQERRKQLWIGPAKGMAVKASEKCAKHTQHANARGVWGHAPPGNF